MRRRKTLTNKPMVLCSLRLPSRDKDLWQAGATREEISQAEFLRRAIRERARRVLLAEEIEAGIETQRGDVLSGNSPRTGAGCKAVERARSKVIFKNDG